MTSGHSNEQTGRIGIVLVNLGTPDEPTTPAIRRYLREFLSDPRVVNLPRWLWLPLLNLVILNVRPAKLVAKYRLIWGTRDGPIRNITRALAQRLQQSFESEEIVVAFAMTYGSPTIARVVERLKKGGVRTLLFVPLYPQYAGATVGAAMDKVARVVANTSPVEYRLVRDYFKNRDYLEAVAKSIHRSYAYRKGKPFVVFSFHGIPEAQSVQGDPYRLQCERTAELVTELLHLPRDRWRLTYQSRFGPAEWLRPYTDETMASLPAEGVRDVLLVCPGFSVDCLETIEEVKVLHRSIFLSSGGDSFSYVKALNATRAHVEVMRSLVKEHLPRSA